MTFWLGFFVGGFAGVFVATIGFIVLMSRTIGEEFDRINDEINSHDDI